MKPLSEMIASFQQIYPDIHFSIYAAIADDVKERLKNVILDMDLMLDDGLPQTEMQVEIGAVFVVR